MFIAENPIIGGNFADPSLIREGEDYYMVHGGHGYYSLLLWHSRDLVHWQALYPILEGFSDPVWAPELVKVDNTYYIYCFGKGTWIIESKNLLDPASWSTPKIIEGVTGIDPGHFVDVKGKRWLFMSNNWVYPLNKAGNAITGKPVQVCEPWPIPDSWDIEGVCCEAPKLLQRGEYIYLIVAEGGTQGPPTSHGIMCFRSKEVLGSWESSPYNPISHCESREEKWWSKGHGTLIDTVKDDWFIMYHGIQKDHRHLGRIPLLEPVEWTHDGWFRIVPTSATDKPFSVHLPLAKVDRYKGSPFFQEVGVTTPRTELGLGWYLRTKDDKKRAQVITTGSDKKSEPAIALSSSGTSLSDTSPLLLHNHYSAQEFSAHLEVRDGSAGGLCFYSSGELSVGISLTNNHICVHEKGRTWSTQVPWKGSTVWLKLRDNHGVISPWYSHNGTTWKKINHCGEVSSWNQNSARPGGFYDCVLPGIFSCKAGETIFSTLHQKELYKEDLV